MSEPMDATDPNSIAIVGLAGRFPAARTAAELWTLLRDGKEATQWLTPDELRAAGVADADIEDPDYVRASLVLPDMEMFDADFFGFSKRDAAVLDPQHRHFLECAWEALEDAGHMPELEKVGRLGEPGAGIDLDERVPPREAVEFIHLAVHGADRVLGRLETEVLAQVALAVRLDLVLHELGPLHLERRKLLREHPVVAAPHVERRRRRRRQAENVFATRRSHAPPSEQTT